METLLYRFTKPNKYIAAFDLDGTLIKTKSGNKFPKNGTDYQYAFDNVQEKLNELLLQKYKIVIFTNQKGIKTKKTNKTDIINKITKLFPFADYFISTDDDLYRKPMIGMFDKFMELNGEVKDIFYVGDAAGRKNDHSYADINFAYNANIKFLTETEYFTGEIDLDIAPLCPEQQGKINKISDMKLYDQYVVFIMQGFPASGKTSFIKDYIKENKIKNSLHLSNDTHTKSKLKKALKKGMEDEAIIFIDNTNATKNNRKEIIDIVKNDKDYNIIGIHITTSMTMAKALNKQRYYISNMDENYKGKVFGKIPYVAYNVFNSRFEKMEKEEGFYKIINFLPDIKLKYFFI